MAERAPEGSELPVLLALAFRAMVDELHHRLAALGFADVRPAHGFAFVRLTPDGATGNELAAHLGVSKQAASQMVDYLEGHSYVTRRPHPRDGRGKIVVLTERGWACIRATEAIFADIERRWAGDIGAERMELLRADLRRLVYATGDDALPRPLRPVW
ncbi:MAG: MarR family transcriptional regulator [Chloroflexi bacterium]|nr:MarR family transcriptional regulator [Chloroflexota bacterium]